MPKNRYIVGNWKMNLDYDQTVALATALMNMASTLPPDLEVIACPSPLYLDRVRTTLKQSAIKLGGQNVFWEDKGPFTGEYSAPMLRDLGVSYVIVGHSERRQHLHETDRMVAGKVSACLRNGLVPIVCIGETFEHRRQGKRNAVVADQLRLALGEQMISPNNRVIVAYEPIWAIGSGQACAPDEAAEAGYAIRSQLFELFSEQLVMNNMALIYGGSVDGQIAAQYVDGQIFSGVLVGGASHRADSFSAVIQSIANLSSSS